ncbi:hypothetical protein ACHAW6_012716 [Cyclotella cf. meneghiniana]
MRSQHQTILVPTFPSEPRKPKQVDVSKLTKDDIQSLRKDDPFMYYSIPGVSKADLLCQPVDCSNLQSLIRGDASCSRVVSRRSRVSTECDFAVLFKDVWGDVSDESCSGDFDIFNTSSLFDAVSPESGCQRLIEVERQAA